MIGEFIYAGELYTIKNRAEPVADDEWPFEFKTYKDAKLFLKSTVGNKYYRNEMLKIAAFFFPFTCQQNNESFIRIQEQQLQLLWQELLGGNLVLLCKRPSKILDL